MLAPKFARLRTPRAVGGLAAFPHVKMAGRQYAGPMTYVFEYSDRTLAVQWARQAADLAVRWFCPRSFRRRCGGRVVVLRCCRTGAFKCATVKWLLAFLSLLGDDSFEAVKTLAGKRKDLVDRNECVVLEDQIRCQLVAEDPFEPL